MFLSSFRQGIVYLVAAYAVTAVAVTGTTPGCTPIGGRESEAAALQLRDDLRNLSNIYVLQF